MIRKYQNKNIVILLIVLILTSTIIFSINSKEVLACDSGGGVDFYRGVPRGTLLNIILDPFNQLYNFWQRSQLNDNLDKTNFYGLRTPQWDDFVGNGVTLVVPTPIYPYLDGTGPIIQASKDNPLFIKGSVIDSGNIVVDRAIIEDPFIEPNIIINKIDVKEATVLDMYQRPGLVNSPIKDIIKPDEPDRNTLVLNNIILISLDKAPLMVGDTLFIEQGLVIPTDIPVEIYWSGWQAVLDLWLDVCMNSNYPNSDYSTPEECLLARANCDTAITTSRRNYEEYQLSRLNK